jgi:hypothetical protein
MNVAPRRAAVEVPGNDAVGDGECAISAIDAAAIAYAIGIRVGGIISDGAVGEGYGSSKHINPAATAC